MERREQIYYASPLPQPFNDENEARAEGAFPASLYYFTGENKSDEKQSVGNSALSNSQLFDKQHKINLIEESRKEYVERIPVPIQGKERVTAKAPTSRLRTTLSGTK